MSKDDSFLYSGLTSASSDKATPREIQREEKESQRIKLKPAAEVVLELLETERNKLYDIRRIFIDRKTTDEEVKIERIVRERQALLISALEVKVRNILKEKV
jgi:hypothetical protein